MNNSFFGPMDLRHSYLLLMEEFFERNLIRKLVLGESHQGVCVINPWTMIGES